MSLSSSFQFSTSSDACGNVILTCNDNLEIFFDMIFEEQFLDSFSIPNIVYDLLAFQSSIQEYRFISLIQSWSELYLTCVKLNLRIRRGIYHCILHVSNVLINEFVFADLYFPTYLFKHFILSRHSHLSATTRIIV